MTAREMREMLGVLDAMDAVSGVEWDYSEEMQDWRADWRSMHFSLGYAPDCCGPSVLFYCSVYRFARRVAYGEGRSPVAALEIALATPELRALLSAASDP